MQELFEYLVDEVDIRKALKTAAAVGAVGGISMLGVKAIDRTIPAEEPVKQIMKADDKVKDLDKEAERDAGIVSLSIAKYFEGEYEMIEKAALRNNCVGEDFLILLAIRKAENGGLGNEFGIIHPKAKNTNLNTQAGWAAATVVKNRERWDGKDGFIDFLGSRYAPVGAKNDPKGLNRNWVRNVKFWIEKLRGNR